MEMEVEKGSALCQCRGGKIKLGRMVKGNSNSVTIPLECPKGCQPVGTVHTHPSSDSYPSPIDIASLRKVRLPISCILGKQGLRCYDVFKSPPQRKV